MWRTIRTGSVTGRLSIAADASGSLWLGQGMGLLRYDGSSWSAVYTDAPVCDVVPAQDGTVYAQIELYSGWGCDVRSDRLVVVRPDGNLDPHPTYVKWIVQNEAARVRTTLRRNDLWSVADDGAIWYVRDPILGADLYRATPSAVTAYQLPVSAGDVKRMEVDRRGEVWVLADSRLWRMAGPRLQRTYLPAILP